MKLVSALIACALFSAITGCSNAPKQTPAASQPSAPPATGAPEYYQGALSWPNVEFILHSSSVGRLVTFGPEYPYSVPVSFAYFDGKVVIHSSAKGAKVANIKTNQRVCFTVDRYNEREGWASINFFGQASVISDPAKKGELMAKFSPAYELPPEQVDEAVAKAKGEPIGIPIVMIEIVPEKITNRLLSVPSDWLKKFPYIFGQIPGKDELPAGAHGGSTKPMPQELITWTLYSCSAGRINTFSKDYPNSIPVNYSYFDNKIYLHSRNFGSKIDDLKQNQKVSFVVDRFNKDRWLSVNIFGTARLINDPKEMALLMQKYSTAFNTLEPDKVQQVVNDVKLPEKDIGASVQRMAERMVLIEITPAEITGRMNNVKLNIPKLPYTLDQDLLIK